MLLGGARRNGLGPGRPGATWRKRKASKEGREQDRREESEEKNGIGIGRCCAPSREGEGRGGREEMV